MVSPTHFEPFCTSFHLLHHFIYDLSDLQYFWHNNLHNNYIQTFSQWKLFTANLLQSQLYLLIEFLFKNIYLQSWTLAIQAKYISKQITAECVEMTKNEREKMIRIDFNWIPRTCTNIGNANSQAEKARSEKEEKREREREIEKKIMLK